MEDFSKTPHDESRFMPGVDYEAVAYHEAAHAVADTATGAGTVQSVELAPEFGAHGWATIANLHPDFEPVLAGDEAGRAYLSSRLTGVLAGPVAEQLAGYATGSYEEWEASEREDQWLDEPGDEPDPTSDYAAVLRLSALCGVPPAEGWARAEQLLREPVVWGAVESVARALLSRKDLGLPPVLDGDELQGILAVDWPEAYQPTTLDEAMDIVRGRSPGTGRAWWEESQGWDRG